VLREVLGIPADVSIPVCIARRGPDRPRGPLERKPLAEGLHRDRG